MVRGLVKHSVGKGSSTSMWLDFWLPNGPIVQQLNLTELEILQLDPQVKVDSLIFNDQWVIPPSLQHIHFFQSQDFISQLQSIPSPTSDTDQVLWLPSLTKQYSYRLILDDFSPPSPVFAWTHLIWFKHHIPKYGYIAWLTLKERLETLDTMPMMKKHYTNVCYVCLTDSESVDHLFFKCKFSSTIWDFVQHATGFYIKPNSWRDLIVWCSSTWTQQHFITHKLLLSCAIYFIWHEINSRAFRNKFATAYQIINLIKGCIRVRFASLKLRNATELSKIGSVEAMQQLFIQGCAFARGQSWFLLQQ
ncbi:uncharacterized protein LOC132309065 [Cornus florida]|uniref:uncharacterized protein LOC132309065 n=1 Tax=Cornus florida TaxID=4283 RepID=UPI0028A26A2E|nr:uncharacterized protein LOC132309065 [Cornus florida]